MNRVLASIFTSVIKNKHKRQQVFDILTNSITLQNNINTKELIGTLQLLKANIDISKIPQATGSLRLQQLFLLHIAKRLVAFLDKHKIEYWLEYGSLIGAVRHGGFVPWDNDIDIAMRREHYERFRALAQSFCVDGLHYKDGDVVQICYKDVPICIDIYAFDYGNSTQVPQGEAYDKLIDTINDICNAIPFEPGTTNLHIPESYKPILQEQYESRILEHKPIPKKAFLFPSFHIKYEIGKRALCAYDEIFPLKQISFEGFSFNCPNDIWTHLYNTYGDFLSLPSGIHNYHKPIDIAVIKQMQELVGEIL